MIYTNIHLRNFADTICYFHEKTALTTIIILEISVILFRGNSSFNFHIFFNICEFLDIDLIKSLVLLHSSS